MRKHQHLWQGPVLFWLIYMATFAGILNKDLSSCLLIATGIALLMLLVNWVGWKTTEKRKAERIKH